jgi:hypothetical protein
MPDNTRTRAWSVPTVVKKIIPFHFKWLTALAAFLPILGGATYFNSVADSQFNRAISNRHGVRSRIGSKYDRHLVDEGWQEIFK